MGVDSRRCGGAVDFSVSLSVSADAANSGLYGDFIIGGVPQTTASVAAKLT
jgi:hypothetical protein